VILLLLLQAFPPTFPGGQDVVTVSGDVLLQPPVALREGVEIAKTAPEVDVLLFPGQDYPGKPWSAWGDSIAHGGKYYASIGDHLAPAGNAFVYAYDPAARKLRRIVDVRATLGMPDGHYTPGKIHGRLDVGKDGRLYCSTHRGGTKVTTDKYHYEGDWILAHDLASGKTEVVTRGAVPKHCVPASVLDPERLIFYGGTAPGEGEKDVRFFAWDVKASKLLYAGEDGPPRYLIFARSTGRVYWTPGSDGDAGPVYRWDPAKGGAPEKLATEIACRAATRETPDGKIYTISKGGKGEKAEIWAFDVKTETAERLGEANVASQEYVASIDADPTGRYLYYSAGAHGGGDKDGTPVVRYDVKTKTRTVVAFLAPALKEKTGIVPVGTYSSALDDDGKTLYVTWNANRGGKAWDVVLLTALRLP
jgi:hypothetical protein